MKHNNTHSTVVCFFFLLLLLLFGVIVAIYAIVLSIAQHFYVYYFAYIEEVTELFNTNQFEPLHGMGIKENAKQSRSPLLQ